jgi:hypothetical protein
VKILVHDFFPAEFCASDNVSPIFASSFHTGSPR